MENLHFQFISFVKDNQLFKPSDKILIGISGGIDSMVLAHLIDSIGNEFALAHCNFNLRGDESDGDEKFVVDYADKLGVKCYLSSFSTKEYAVEKGISIEMAARDLRYEWFENLSVAKGFNWIAVGHHLDDVLETFILNLSRGTGIRGLSGIKSKAGKIIRPLLFASRLDIEEYARLNHLSSRYDSSNGDINIKRNKVRHQIIPLIEELNPSFKNNLQNTIQYLNDTEVVFLSKIEKIKNKLLRIEGNWIRISKKEILELNPLQIYLYELLREFGFKSDIIGQIINSLKSNAGIQFFTATHRLVVDREDIIITLIAKDGQKLFYITKKDKFLYQPINLRINVERYDNEFRIPTNKEVAVIDYDNLRFPLVLRKWKSGEYFKPLGMDGFKKLSDFFIDEKYSIPEKEEAWILISDNKVVWIVGKRIDDRFKITGKTKLLMRIELINAENA